MRAKSDILQDLASKLNDDIWKKLQNSLLGRELLALGAEIISENENVKDTMLLQMNPDTADKYGLYMLSQMNEIPITNVKPSTVTVEMRSNVRTYAPYELSYSIGNVHFTNIEYTMQGKSVSLINGTYKCYARGVEPSEGAVEDGSETYFYDGTNSYSGIKLGNAYPDSIVVYDENGLEIPRYSSDIALSDNVDMMYKVITGVDGNIYIRFLSSDSIYSNPVSFKIDWLDHSAMEFDVEDYEVKDGNNVVADIKYYSQGNTDDLDYMRNQIKKEMAKYNGLNTPASVESYVRGLPYVLDAKCEKSENGINVYIKPSSETMDYQAYLDFSEIAAHISLNSILFPNIKVKTGSQIRFGVEVSGVSDVKLQNSIKSLLQERYAYENMDFNTIINTSNILSEIYAKYGVVPTVNMTIKEPFVNNKPLSFKPIQNTLKLYNNSDAVVAWEENEMLYGMTAVKNSLPFNNFKVVASMGTMFLLMYDRSEDSQTIAEKTGDIELVRDKELVILVDQPWSTQGKDLDKVYKVQSGDTYDIYAHNGSAWVRLNNDVHNISMLYLHPGEYNKFYLYDANTNTVKPFDGCMQNLLYSDANPNLKYDAWNQDKQTFGNLYDINFLSTNNALVVHIVFKSAGTELKEMVSDNKMQYELQYWSNENTELYQDYLNSNYTDFNANYNGKYQTIFFISNPLAFKNFNNESLEIFQKCSNGNPNDMQGLYSGLRNIREDGVQLNTKTNWFVYKNKAYYAYEITDNYVCITNGAKNLKVNLNGSFLGMMPFEDDLYVISERFITKVIGFEGLKEKEEVYKTYKDYNTPITIVQIMREFDNQIAFKTSDGKYYTATGFEVLTDNIISFKDFKQIFDDIVFEGDVNLGGCNQNYITAYKEINDEESIGYEFYCYDLNTSKTSVHAKIASIPSGEGTSVETEPEEDTCTVTEWWGANETAIKYFSQNGWRHGSRLFYKDGNGEFVEIDKKDYKNLFFYVTEAKAQLCIDNIADKAYDVYESGGYEIVDGVIVDTYSDSDTKRPVSRVNNNKKLDWNEDGDGIHSDYIAGFYKQCFYAMILAESESKTKINNDKNAGIQPNGKPFYELYRTFSETIENGEYKKVVISRYTRSDSVTILGPSGSYTTATKTFTPKISESIYKINNGGQGSKLTDNADEYHRNKPYPVGTTVIGEYYFNIQKFYTKTTTTTIISDSSVTLEDDTKEMTTVGYIDTAKNSLVNDKGVEAKYVRYNTLNPNVTSSSYLVLDEEEIKFV